MIESIKLEVGRQESTPTPLQVDSSVELLRAACDPIRWVVLQRLGRGKTCVCDLQDLVPIAPNLLSYHLKVLRDAGLVTTSRRGRWVDYTLADDAAAQLHSALPLATA
jgi:ArsR family transcriptional regulator